MIDALQRSINHYTAALIDIVRGKNYIEDSLKICHNVHPAETGKNPKQLWLCEKQMFVFELCGL